MYMQKGAVPLLLSLYICWNNEIFIIKKVAEQKRGLHGGWLIFA